ncbi:hypothetical protein C0J52_00146 [Blattella germanica]|nr:hypothetical protein C0J52_00146 [Blattella germanica]
MLTDIGQVIGYSTDLAGETKVGEPDHKVGCVIGLFISLLHLVGDVLLLLGADKGKAQWVKYAVMNHFISLVLAVISFIALSIFYKTATILLAGVILSSVAGYCWLVIYSFYWQLIEVAMTETQAQLETSALTKPTEYSANLADDEKRLAY